MKHGPFITRPRARDMLLFFAAFALARDGQNMIFNGSRSHGNIVRVGSGRSYDGDFIDAGSSHSDVYDSGFDMDYGYNRNVGWYKH